MNDRYSQLNILVIGLGSMGKRRIRNLKANGVERISGFDLRSDRRKETAEQYSIPIFASVEVALDKSSYDAWIISVPPDKHHVYMKSALEKNVPCFIEASVVDIDMAAMVKQAQSRSLFMAPSCTL